MPFPINGSSEAILLIRSALQRNYGSPGEAISQLDQGKLEGIGRYVGGVVDGCEGRCGVMVAVPDIPDANS